MDKHDATEQAYKNGYAAGAKDFAKFLIDEAKDRKIQIIDLCDYVHEFLKGGNSK